MEYVGAEDRSWNIHMYVNNQQDKHPVQALCWTVKDSEGHHDCPGI